jgi:cellulose synthase operon protein C
LHPARLLRRAAAGSGAGAAPAPAPALAAVVLAVLAGLAACAGRAAGPPPISPQVRAEVELAERAELARDHAAARRHYDVAIARAVAAGDPASLRFARRELAETLISWGELAGAEDQLEHLVAAAPEDAAGWHDLGMVRHGLGDGDGAIAALARARRLVPGDPRPRIALAALYWKRGDQQAARAEYQALLSLELPDRVRDKVRWALDQLAR